MPTVLVADDDPGLRALARVTLAAQGWRVLEASTPAEGVALAKEHLPEVMLLDVTFEGHARDGYAMCREITAGAETRDIRIVLFTARDDPESRAFASAVGATAFIVKPFRPLDLVRVLRLVREQPSGEPGIGLYLIESGVINPTQLDRALAEQRAREGKKTPLGEVLVELGLATPEDVRSALERQRRIRPVSAPPARSRVRLRLVIADDNASVREGLRELIGSQDDLTLVGVASDGAEALRLTRELRPDLVVLDNDMPRLSGMDVVQELRTATPETAAVIFTLNDAIREEALASGAAAVLTKDMPLDALLAEIRRHGRRSQPPAAPSTSVVLTTRGAARAWGAVARRRRAIGVVGILLVAYAAVFLVTEPIFGASSSVFALLVVAAGGALLGPEAGVAIGLLCAIESAVLWGSTGHGAGEPILRIGGNGIGIVALMGVGAGFGAMRVLRGRLDQRARQAGALAEAALALSGGLDPRTLGLLTEAALDVVPGDAALLYVSVPGGGLELVAVARLPQRTIGERHVATIVSRAHADGQPAILSEDRAASMRAVFPDARYGLVVPLARRGDSPSGVIVVLSARRRGYRPEHLDALSSYGSFVASLLSTSPAAIAIPDTGGAVEVPAMKQP